MNVIRLLMAQVRPLVRLRRRVAGPYRPSWTEEFETIATVLRRGTNVSVLLPLALQRQLVDPSRPSTPIVSETKIHERWVAGVRTFVFDPVEADAKRTVIYLHGGGYSVGSVTSHLDLIARIARDARARVYAPEYRLAPEFPFPAQLDDAIAVYRALLADDIDASSILFVGDSAGGGLSLSTMIALRDRGLPSPAGAALLSPWVDLDATGASMDENAPYDFVTRRGLEVYARRFVGLHDRKNPLAAPIHADLRGLAPLLVQVGGAETLRDDGVRLAAVAREAGLEVELEIYPDMIHVFQIFTKLVAAADDAVAKIGAFCQARVPATPDDATRAASAK